MSSFTYFLPETSLLFGSGTLGELGARARPHGSRALLVTGNGSMRRQGFLQRARESLEGAGIPVTLFEGVEPNPTAGTVSKGIRAGLDSGCDLVAAIGGGSSIDAAKAMAVGIGHGDADVWPYILRERETTRKTLPVMAVPSTSGTGSHVTWYTVITNQETGEKAAFSSKFIYPSESVVDLDIVSTMPPKVTAETGFDALAHVMESYLSSGATPMTDTLCLRAMKLIRQNLVRAFKDGSDMDAREGMALADTYAGLCITPSRTIMVHGIGNTVSGVYPELAHGQALACLTPPVMRFNIERGDASTVSRYCDIARALGEETARADRGNAMKAVEAVEMLQEAIGLRRGLKECGVSEDSIERMADYSLKFGKGAIACNPVKPAREDIIKVYEEAL